MGAGFEGMKYILIIRDEISSFVWLHPADAANAEVTALALSGWIASFSTMDWLVSDQGSHFMNELNEELFSKYKVRRHFTTAYSPWANSTVERVCREVLRSCKALLSGGILPRKIGRLPLTAYKLLSITHL